MFPLYQTVFSGHWASKLRPQFGRTNLPVRVLSHFVPNARAGLQALLFPLLISTFMPSAGFSREWYVAATGHAEGAGTEQDPLGSVRAALERAQAGDVCIVRGGTYRETAEFQTSGEPGKPVRIQSYPGEAVVFDGTEAVAGKWQKYKGSIYMVKLPSGAQVEQLFVGRAMMTEARWPNAGFEQAYDRTRWAKVEPGSTHGRVVSKEVAGSGIDWTGAMACLNVAHQWWTWNRPITKHAAGSADLEYDADLVGLCGEDPKVSGKKPGDLEKVWGDDYFYLFGKLEALDVETEWFHDRKTGILYFFAPGGGDPSKLDVRYKARNYAITARNKSYLEISGINFFATTFRLEDCSHALVENCELLYPSYSRTITEFDQERRESVFTKITGDHNTVRRCSIAYTNNLGLMVMGDDNTVENCIIHDVNWTGTLIYPALQLSASPHLGVNWFDTIQYPPTPRTIENSDATSRGNVASHNTLYNAGSALLVYQAADSIVEYNHIHDGGLACKDVSLVYGCWPFSRGSIVRYNWVHGCVTDGYGGRGGHGGIGIRADDQSRNNIFHHNVVWDCGEIGITMKGEDNLCYNNTVFDIGTQESPQMDILLETGAEPIKIWAVQWPQLQRQNQWSRAANNIALNLTGSHKLADQLADSERVHHNLRAKDAASLLKDPANFDFRPKPGSALVDAGTEIPGYTDGFQGKAPDLGAYESGGERWVAGADWKESFTLLEPAGNPANTADHH